MKKRYCSAIYKIWREVIFPPFCMHCKERSNLKFFCFDCWQLCSAPDPTEKCPHCFGNSEGLCLVCRKNPDLPFPQAHVFEDVDPCWLLARQEGDTVAAFAMLSWIGLKWEVPDVVIAIQENEWAFPFSEMLGKPLMHLSRDFRGNYRGVEAIHADQTLLLVGDRPSLQECKQMISALSSAFPKRGYLLSLFPFVEKMQFER